MQQMVKTYAARRRLKIGKEYRDGPARGHEVTVENLVPEAHLWFRQESWLHTGWMTEVEVPIEDLFGAFELRNISSTDCLAILARLGLKDGVEVSGPHHSPREPGPKPPRARQQVELHPGNKTGPGTVRTRTTPVAPKKAPVKKSTAKAPKTAVRAKTTTTSKKGAGTAVTFSQHELVE